MDIKTIDKTISVSPQISVDDLAAIRAAGYRSIICNRPDGEGADQPTFAEIEKAARASRVSKACVTCPSSRAGRDKDAEEFGEATADLARTGAGLLPHRHPLGHALVAGRRRAKTRPCRPSWPKTKAAGYDMAGVVRRIANGGRTPTDVADLTHDIVIVGGGAAGISLASSLLARDGELDIALIDPADIHYYQPGWTMVGGGIFDARSHRQNHGLADPGGSVSWIKAAVAAFEPADNAVILDGCRVVRYNRLIVAPGLKLDWDAIEGLPETLGRNGVTSNYRYDLAPYTWKLVEGLKSGKAIFTQPPMPIKCAGAPQKALYLSADHWFREERAEGHRHPVLQRRRRAVRRQGICTGADGIYREVQGDAELLPQSGRGSTGRRRRPGFK